MASEKKIVVPDGMRVAAAKAVHETCGKVDYHPQIRIALEAALCWLSENPIVPTHEQLQKIADFHKRGTCYPESINLYVVGFQECMFLAPEPVPEDIKDLLCAGEDTVKEAYFRPDIYNERIIEAYRRGQKAQQPK